MKKSDSKVWFMGQSSIETELGTNIIELIKARENITLRGLPGCGKSHFAHLLSDTIEMEQYVGKEFIQSSVFIFGDFNLSYTHFLEQIEESINFYADSNSARAGIMKLLRDGKDIYFVIDNFCLNHKLIKYLTLLRNINIRKIQFIFLTTPSAFQDLKGKTHKLENYIFSNIYDIPYLREEVVEAWIRKCGKELSLKLTEEDINKVKEFSGGIPLLIKNYLRKYRKYKSHERAINADGLDIIITTFWNEFFEEEKNVIKLIGTKNLNTKKLSKKHQNQLKGSLRYTLNYLINLRLLDYSGNVRGTWYSKVLNTNKIISIQMKGDTLNWEGLNLNSVMTDNEIVALRTIISAKTYATRDMLEKTVYGKETTEWAIDKFISRLRKKLDSIGIGGEKIETIKGQGYKGTNIKII